MDHRGLKVNKNHITDEPGLTLAYSIALSQLLIMLIAHMSGERLQDHCRQATELLDANLKLCFISHTYPINWDVYGCKNDNRQITMMICFLLLRSID